MMKLTNMVRGTADDSAARQLLQCWEHDEGTLAFWRASSNFVYVFDKNGIRHYLRFICEEDNTVERMQAELDFVLYLIAGGYPAAAPVRSLNGRWIETVETPNAGRCHGVVFEQAAGTHVPLEQMSDRHFEDWGRSLAELHLRSESYPVERTWGRSWDEALDFIAAVLERHPHELAARNELGRLRERLAELPTGPALTGWIHYDFETDNIAYMAEESRYSAFDFDDAMVHWYVMDIAAALGDLPELGDEAAQRKKERFIAGYRSVRALEEEFEAALPLFQRFDDLYSFARIMRSLEGFDESKAPEWAVRLKSRLTGMCGEIGGRWKPAVRLRPVESGNWHACTQLEVAPGQERTFPVPIVYWLAESAYCGFTPLALYSGEQLAGFAAYACDPDDGSYWIMAYMIDRRYQQRGIGRSGMEELISYIAEQHGCDALLLGHRPDNEPASRLYESLGFEAIGHSEHEIIRRLNLNVKQQK